MEFALALLFCQQQLPPLVFADQVRFLQKETLFVGDLETRAALWVLTLEELSPLPFWLRGHKDGGHAGVHHVHVGKELVDGLRLSHLAMGHEDVGHLVTFLPHVFVIAELLHCSFEHFCETSAVLQKVISDVGDSAKVVVDRGDVYIGIPVDNPLGIIIIDENFINVALQKDFTPLPWLLDNCSFIHFVCDGLASCRGFPQHFLDPLPDVCPVFFRTFSLHIIDSVWIVCSLSWRKFCLLGRFWSLGVLWFWMEFWRAWIFVGWIWR
jgi:hypothetical protein